jgi:signal peptidase II
LRILFVTLFVVLADQISKLWVKGISIPYLGISIEGMAYQSSIPVFGNWFKITFIENPGMAFGLQIGGKLFLSLFTIFATGLLFYFLYKNKNSVLLLRLALALILAGAIGNLIDRVFYGVIFDYAPLFYGRVVDFLHVDFPDFNFFGKRIYSWPIFNVADISVTVGFLLIVFGYKKIFKHEHEEIIVIDDLSLARFSDDNFVSEKENMLDRNDFVIPELTTDN